MPTPLHAIALLLAILSATAIATPPPGVPATVRDLPLTEIRGLTGNKIGWAYAHYTRGRGLGSARLEIQSPVLVAQTVPQSVLTVTAGPGGIAPGGTISVMYPMGSTPPQTEDSKGAGYTTATLSGNALDVQTQLVWFFRQDKYFSGKIHRAIATIQLAKGLDEGRSVVFTKLKAHPGNMARRWDGQQHIFRVYIDHDADGWEEEISESPWVPRLPAVANRLMVRAQSTAVVEEPVRVLVTAMDRFDNPASGYRGTITLSASDESASLPGRYDYTRGDASAHAFSVHFKTPGYYWLTVRDEDNNFVSESNPIEVLAEEPAYRLYWGDLHVHTEMSGDAVNGVMVVSSYDGSYNIGRFRYGLDFMANADHHSFAAGNYSYEDWQQMVALTNQANVPGKFVTLLASEMSHGRGDQNVYFRGDTMPFLSTGPRHPMELWNMLRVHESFTVPHHFAQSMRPWDWAQYDEELMPVAEIFSLHGRGEFHNNKPHYSKHREPTLEGQTWQDQLAKGRQLGAIAASDSHRARPGFAGLAGVWAKTLSRADIYDNIKSRHSYASTNARAILHFEVNGMEMGQAVTTSSQPILRLYGATPTEILEIHVVKDNEVVYAGQVGGRVFDITWEDTDFDKEAYYYVRVKMKGHPQAENFLRGKPEFVWSSPVWVKRS